MKILLGENEMKTRMRNVMLGAIVVVLVTVSVGFADTFGTGANQFDIDFVTISGDTNPTSGYGIVNNDYRIGVYEITNDQWDKFKNAYGTVTGNPSYAYDESPYWTGTDVPTNEISWYEAAQFVNWLNTDAGYAPAYKFTGTQGTGNYSLGVWQPGDAGYDAANPYRNSNAYYFLPTEDEWVKAAYWNGVDLHTYATKVGETLHQGDGTSGTGWNYWDPVEGYAIDTKGPWDVGSGSDELNGTFDMTGNLWEWIESPYDSGVYTSGTDRVIRGGAYNGNHWHCVSSLRYGINPNDEGDNDLGFRVASVSELPLAVEIDIKPGSYPNSINLGSHGLVPVAILSNSDFDATTVDPETVALAGADVTVRGKSNKYMAHEEDVNGDGLADLVLQVATENLDPGAFQDGYVFLTGNTYDGQEIEGSDEITIVPQ